MGAIKSVDLIQRVQAIIDGQDTAEMKWAYFFN